MSIEKILGESFDDYLDSLIEEFEQIDELSREKLHSYLSKSLNNFDSKRTKNMKLANKKIHRIDTAQGQNYKPTAKEKTDINSDKKDLNKQIDDINKTKNKNLKIQKAKETLDRMNRNANYGIGEYRRIQNLKSKARYHEEMSKKNPEKRQYHLDMMRDSEEQYKKLQRNRNNR